MAFGATQGLSFTIAVDDKGSPHLTKIAQGFEHVSASAKQTSDVFKRMGWTDLRDQFAKTDAATNKLRTGVTQLNQAAGSAPGIIGTLGGAWVSLAAKVYLAERAYQALRRVTDAVIGDTVREGAALFNLSRSLGIPIEVLSKFSFAAKQANVEIGTLGMGLRLMRHSFVEAVSDPGSKAAQTLRRLGLDAKDMARLLRQDAVTQVLALADAFGKWENDAVRADAARQIFGRGVEAFNRLIEEGSATLRKNIAEGIAWTEQQGKNADDLKDAFGRLENAWTRIKHGFLVDTGAVESLAKGLEKIADLVDRITKSPEALARTFESLIGIASIAMPSLAPLGMASIAVLRQKQAQEAESKWVLKPVPAEALAAKGGRPALSPPVDDKANKAVEDFRKKLEELRAETDLYAKGLSESHIQQEMQIKAFVDSGVAAGQNAVDLEYLARMNIFFKQSAAEAAEASKFMTGTVADMQDHIRVLRGEITEADADLAKFTRGLPKLTKEEHALAVGTKQAEQALEQQIKTAKELEGAYFHLGASLEKGLLDVFDALISGTRSVADAFEGLKLSIVKSLAEAFIEGLKKKAGFEKDVGINLVQFGQNLMGIVGGIFTGQGTGGGGVTGALWQGVFGGGGAVLPGAAGAAGTTAEGAAYSAMMASRGYTASAPVLAGGVAGTGGGGLLGGFGGASGLLNLWGIFQQGSALFSRAAPPSDFGVRSALQNLGLNLGKVALTALAPFLVKIPVIGPLLGSLLGMGGGAFGIGSAGVATLPAGIMASAELGGATFGAGVGSGAGASGGLAGLAGGLSAVLSVIGAIVSIASAVKGVLDTSKAFKKATLGSPETKTLRLGGLIGTGVGAVMGVSIGGAVGLAAGGPIGAVIGAALGAAIGATIAQVTTAAIAKAVGKGLAGTVKRGGTQEALDAKVQADLQRNFTLIMLGGPLHAILTALLTRFVTPSIELIFDKLIARMATQLTGFPINRQLGARPGVRLDRGGREQLAELRGAGDLSQAHLFARVLASITGAGRDNAERIARYTNMLVNSLLGLGKTAEQVSRIIEGAFRELTGHRLLNAFNLIRGLFPISWERRADERLQPDQARQRDQERDLQNRALEKLVAQSYERALAPLDVRLIIDVFRDVSNAIRGAFGTGPVRKSMKATAAAAGELFAPGLTTSEAIVNFATKLGDAVREAITKGLTKALLQTPIADLLAPLFRVIRRDMKFILKVGLDEGLPRLLAHMKQAGQTIARIFGSPTFPKFIEALIEANRQLQRTIDAAMIRSLVASGDTRGAQDYIMGILAPYKQRVDEFRAQAQAFQDIRDQVAGVRGGKRAGIDIVRRQKAEVESLYEAALAGDQTALARIQQLLPAIVQGAQQSFAPGGAAMADTLGFVDRIAAALQGKAQTLAEQAQKVLQDQYDLLVKQLGTEGDLYHVLKRVASALGVTVPNPNVPAEESADEETDRQRRRRERRERREARDDTEPTAGRRQFGGSVDANRPYLVGEREAEWFVPRTAGVVVPISSATTPITVHLNFGDVVIHGAKDPRDAADAFIRRVTDRVRAGQEPELVRAVQSALRSARG